MVPASGPCPAERTSTSDYMLVFDRRFNLISFSVDEENTTLFEHSSNTICELLTPTA